MKKARYRVVRHSTIGNDGDERDIYFHAQRKCIFWFVHSYSAGGGNGIVSVPYKYASVEDAVNAISRWHNTIFTTYHKKIIKTVELDIIKE